MADFAGLLKKTIDAQSNPTPQLRARVYERARETVERKLAEANVAEHIANAQRKALESAVKSVEAEYLAIEQALLEPILEQLPIVQAAQKDSSENISTNHPDTGSDDKSLPKAGHERVDIIPSKSDEQLASADTTWADRQDKTPQQAIEGNQTTYQNQFERQNFEKAGNLHDIEPHISKADKPEDFIKTDQLQQHQAQNIGDTRSVTNIDTPSFTTPQSGNVGGQASTEFQDFGSKSHVNVPPAEPVNMSEILAVEAQHAKQTAENEQRATAAMTSSPQSGDYDIVSDIFVQAARRGERQAAKRRALIVGGSVIAFVVVVGIVLLTAWNFIANRKTGNAEQPVIGENQTDTQTPNTEKLTQRLLADGTEVNAGPAEPTAAIGEGTSTAAATAGVSHVETPGEAVFYRARTENQAEKVETGSVQWSLVKEPTSEEGVEELAVRGNVTIPDENLTLRMTLRRNTDPTMPAAYLLELIFVVPDNFEGQAIDNIKELTFKASEQSAGQALSGTIASKIDDDMFFFALSGARPFVTGNLQLMRQLGWIRIVTTDKDGRVNELTFSKGKTGDEIFRQVIDKWLEQEEKPTVYDQNNQRARTNTPQNAQ